MKYSPHNRSATPYCLMTAITVLMLSTTMPAQYFTENFSAPNSAPVALGGIHYSVIAANLNQNSAADLIYYDNDTLGTQTSFLVDLDPAVTGVGPYVSQSFGIGMITLGGAWDAMAGDVNGDGLTDLLFTRFAAASINLGNGNGTFLPPTAIIAVNYINGIISGMAPLDANHDGLLDFVCIQYPNNNSASLVVGLNQYPAWTFATIASINVAIAINGSKGPFVGDFDGDGNHDILLQNSLTYSGPMYTLVGWGNGTGQFTWSNTQLPGFPAPGPSTGFPLVRATRDMNGDGRSDLVCSTMTSAGGQLMLFLGTSLRTVIPAGSHAVPSTVDISAAEVHADDFNVDGLGDVLYVAPMMINFAQCEFTVVMALGLPGGQLHPAEFLSSHGPNNGAFCPLSMIADFDGDGDVDLVGAPRDGSFFYFNNNALTGTGCSGSGAAPPGLWPSSAQVGNPGFSTTIYGALTNAPSVLAIATSLNASPINTCGVYLDFSGPVVFLPGVTNTNGNIVWSLPIPANPLLHGAAFRAQAAVLDPLGPTLGGLNLALTPARTVIVW